MNDGELKELIKGFGKAPDSQIDEQFRARCEEFDGDDPVRFMRDLRDELVHCGASTGFVITAISAALVGRDPEPRAEHDARIAELEAKYGGRDGVEV